MYKKVEEKPRKGRCWIVSGGGGNNNNKGEWMSNGIEIKP